MLFSFRLCDDYFTLKPSLIYFSSIFSSKKQERSIMSEIEKIHLLGKLDLF